MRIRLTLLASLLALVCPIAAQADTFQYQFIGSFISYYSDFTFDTASLITTDTTVTPTFCSVTDDGSTGTCSSIFVQPESYGSNFTLTTSISTPYGPLNVQIDTTFNVDQLGRQTNGYDTLIVTDEPSATPEPSSLALLGTGILAFAGMARKRFA